MFEKRTIRGVPKNEENLEENSKGYHIFGQNIKYQYPQKILVNSKYLTQVEENKPILAYTSSTCQIGMIKESFYRTGNNGAFQGLFPKFKNYTYKSLNFILTQLIRIFSGFSYDTGMANALEIKFFLPIKNGKIDFEFMENFVAELEAQRVAELEAYLNVTGLQNYELTEEEKDAIKNLENVECAKYRIGDLFEIKPTKSYKYTNSDLFNENGKYPVVTNSSNNNGITGYTNLAPTERGNIITYSDTTTDEGIFYQPRDFVGYSHIQGLYPIFFHDKWNEKTLIYIVSAFKKAASGKFDYGNKFNRKIAKELTIQLPTKNGEIDFEFMETLIKAVQKLVIKDVVCWADKKVETTKTVIAKNK